MLFDKIDYIKTFLMKQEGNINFKFLDFINYNEYNEKIILMWK